MPRATKISSFVKAESAILDTVTKFGGQPVWIENPVWPLSPVTHKPIPFLGQIALDSQIFGRTIPSMAYVFYGTYDSQTDTIDDEAKAVVLQPGCFNGPFEIRAHGPSLTKTVVLEGKCVSEPCEYAVQLDVMEDPLLVDIDERYHWTEDESDHYLEQLSYNKIGGTPAVWEEYHFPSEFRDGQLLLQLFSPDSVEGVPFDLDYGDGGCGWVFLSGDQRRAHFEYASL